MQSGYDATRRSRKIGTTDRAWSDKKGNQLEFAVPWPTWEWRVPAERWDPEDIEEITVHGRPVTIVTNKLRKDHIFTVDSQDICNVLNRLPQNDVLGLDLLVLHQETRKAGYFSSAWGRIFWSVDFRGYFGPAVLIDSINTSKKYLRFKRSLDPDRRLELERLLEIGFQIEEDRRDYKLVIDTEVVRRLQLLRTLPHEVGHWVDYRKWVLDPVSASGDSEDVYEQCCDSWHRRPTKEREDAAWRYVDSVREILDEIVL